MVNPFRQAARGLWIFGVVVVATIGQAAPVLAQDSESNLLQRLTTFNDVLRIIRANYVDEVDPEKLVDSAIEGLLTDLDPHSNYLDPKRSAETNERYRGEYYGIGISFAIRDGYISVTPIQPDLTDHTALVITEGLTHGVKAGVR